MAAQHTIEVGPDVVERVAKSIGGPKWTLDGYEVTDRMRRSARDAITSYEWFRNRDAKVIFTEATGV
jgi:hypothetical protein